MGWNMLEPVARMEGSGWLKGMSCGGLLGVEFC